MVKRLLIAVVCLMLLVPAAAFATDCPVTVKCKGTAKACVFMGTMGIGGVVVTLSVQGNGTASQTTSSDGSYTVSKRLTCPGLGEFYTYTWCCTADYTNGNPWSFNSTRVKGCLPQTFQFACCCPSCYDSSTNTCNFMQYFCCGQVTG